MAFVSGNMTYFIKSEKNGQFSDLEQIRKLHFELQEEIKPYKRLDLNLDYPSPDYMKLIEPPQNITPMSSSMFLSSAECLKTKLEQISSEFINKETLWLAFLCNQIDTLPKTFFESPPFLHQNGLSYSYMRYKMTRNEIDRLRWLESHGKFMHLQELKKLEWPSSINQRFLFKQPDDTVAKILNKEHSFFTNDFYFIKNGALKYYVVETNRAQRFFARAGYEFSLDGESCIFKIGNICWKKKARNLQSFLFQSTTVLFLVTLIMLILAAHSLYTRLKKKKLEEERKRHALRVLTHELRTPIASLILQTNLLSKEYHNFSHETQEHLMKIESQVYRLKHLAQKSLSYLQTDTTKLIQLNDQHLPSLVEFIEEILNEYDDKKIVFTYDHDKMIDIDAYWLKMCIANLIENAIRYGEGEIRIFLETQLDQKIRISVSDEGSLPYKNLKELLKSKHQNSKGLGLGLIIISKTLKEMGAKLSLCPSPTKFTIEVPVNNSTKNLTNEVENEKNIAN